MAASSLGAQDKVFTAQTWISGTFVLVLAAVASKGLGFVREVLVARYFGASAQVDAFVVALTLTTLVGGAGLALSTAFIPTYRERLARGEPSRARDLAGNAIVMTVVLSAVLMGALILLSRSLIEGVTPGLPPATVRLAAHLTQWLSIVVLGISLYYMLGAIYNALEHFTTPAFTDLISSASALIALIAFSSSMGIWALVVGMVVGTSLVPAFLALPLASRRLISIHAFSWNRDVQDLLVLAGPVLLIDILYQCGTIIENYFGAGLSTGTISALGFARRLTVTVVSILGINIARAAFPVLSRLVSERNVAGAGDLFAKLIRYYVVAFVPVSISLMYFRSEIVRLVFFGGAFDEAAVAKTATAFLYYSAGLVFAAMLPLFLRTCYALSNASTPLLATALGLVVMVCLNYLLVPTLGVGGIALSSSLSLLPGLALMGLILSRALRSIHIGSSVKALLVALGCGIAALAPVTLLENSWRSPHHAGVALSAALVVYFLAYFGLGWFLMREEVERLWALMRRGY